MRHWEGERTREAAILEQVVSDNYLPIVAPDEALACLRCGLVIVTGAIDLHEALHEVLLDRLGELSYGKQYDPGFGDTRACTCGHPYHRHFDTYEDMRPVGCKYCVCQVFTERET